MAELKYTRLQYAAYGTLAVSFVACVVSFAAAAATYWWGLPAFHVFMGTASALAIVCVGSLIAGIVAAFLA